MFPWPYTGHSKANLLSLIGYPGVYLLVGSANIGVAGSGANQDANGTLAKASLETAIRLTLPIGSFQLVQSAEKLQRVQDALLRGGGILQNVAPSFEDIRSSPEQVASDKLAWATLAATLNRPPNADTRPRMEPSLADTQQDPSLVNPAHKLLVSSDTITDIRRRTDNNMLDSDGTRALKREPGRQNANKGALAFTQAEFEHQGGPVVGDAAVTAAGEKGCVLCSKCHA